VLVAAGPVPVSGEGMTVVRVPPDEVDLWVGQADDDDLSVAGGDLEVGSDRGA
jgi:hypothetical protein